MKNKLINIVRTAVGVMLFSSVASAATTIHIKSVEQRWPWNNKVDITYKVTGGQDVSQSKFYRIVFTTVIDGVTYTIDGNSIGASADDNEHTVTWTAPDGVRCADCTMSAAIYEANAPSGNDYMIVDLTKSSDNVAFEGLLATQGDSDKRYAENEAYKTEKLVLRRIPAGGPYYVTSTTTKTTDRDYYVGIFPVTQRQYELVCSDAAASSLTSENMAKPKVSVSWNSLRTAIRSTASIPEVDAENSGTFFQRLCYKTGKKFAFDLPTDMMFALAARAGVTTTYFWGDQMDSTKIVCKESDNALTKVGSRAANTWGLFDVHGNVWEWSRDNFSGKTYHSSNFVSRSDVFTPYYREVENDLHTWLGGHSYNMASTQVYFQLDRCAGDVGKAAIANNTVGFRVSVVME